jgi:hypothetical protein
MGDLDWTLPRACKGGKDVAIPWASGGGTSKTGLDDVLAPAGLSMLLEIRGRRAICSLGTIEVGLEPLDAFVACMEQIIISSDLNEVRERHPPERFLHPLGAAQVNCWKLRPLSSFLVATSGLKN